MNAEQSYNQWLQSKRVCAVSDDFAAGVLGRITAPRRKIKRTAVLSEMITEWVNGNLSMKTTMVAAGGFGGVLRVCVVVYFLLAA